MGHCQDTRRNFKRISCKIYKYYDCQSWQFFALDYYYKVLFTSRPGLRIWTPSYAVLLGRLRIWTFLAFDPDPQSVHSQMEDPDPVLNEPDPETCKFDHFKPKFQSFLLTSNIHQVTFGSEKRALRIRIQIRTRRIRMFLELLDSNPERYGSASLCHQAKIVRKTLIPTFFVTFLYFLSLKNDVNVPSKEILSRKTFF